MTKHIIGQAIFQFIIMMIFLFVGTKFLPSGYAGEVEKFLPADFPHTKEIVSLKMFETGPWSSWTKLQQHYYNNNYSK